MSKVIRPGRAFYATATKAVVDGAPCIELGFPGMAVKEQPAPGGTGLGSALITTIAIGEAFHIELEGEVEVANANAAGGTFAKGDAVWIDPDDNSLTSAHAGNEVKYGRVSEIAGSRGLAAGSGLMRVNLNMKDTF